MTEYIKRETVVELLNKWADGYSYIELPTKDAIAYVRAIPAADVVEVVRCKDCKYSYESVSGWCCSHGICVDCIVREDFFCGDGEAK